MSLYAKALNSVSLFEFIKSVNLRVCVRLFLHERVCKCIRVLSRNIFSFIPEGKLEINYVLERVCWFLSFCFRLFLDFSIFY